MNVLMISPGFPADMPHFTRGLARVGAHVLGVGDQPKRGLAPEVSEALTAYLEVPRLWDEEAVVESVREWTRGHAVDRVECLWEPGVVLAAKLRAALGVPGMDEEQAIAFRDKERMKEVLDQHGVRTPRHSRARTQDECRASAEEIGYPLIIKPIAGAGSADTYRLDADEDLEKAFRLLDHVPEVSVEEYIEGEEYTYDTVCSDGRILFENVSWYRPKPLVMRQNSWISPQAICLRDLSQPDIQKGVELGHAVLEALGFQTGFTHMEWFLTPDGEAVFGEIGARSAGGRLVHGMNFSADIDLFTGWAEAVCRGELSQDTTKQYNAAVVFKRAQGGGSLIKSIEGLGSVMARYGDHIPLVDLVPVGQPRRDWRQVVVGDGWLVGRHPSLDATLEIADALATDLRILA